MTSDFFSFFLPSFLPQCCDAVLYLLQGETCATNNECYDQLRPIGAQLWFSLPYRLGLAPEWLIPVHWLMLCVSIALSVKAAKSLLGISANNKTFLPVFISGSTIIHVVFFWPIMPLALTDAPAALFALIAIWLLIRDGKQANATVLALAGLLFGLSAWIRFAYLYPLYGALVIYLLFWLFNKQRRKIALLLFTALIPVVTQYAFTFVHHQTFGYLGPRASLGLSAEHSLSIAAGQETILPQQQYLWPTNCEHKIGIEQAFQERDISAALCLMANRFYFSFGSYSPDTYMFAATNLLTHSTIEQVGLDNRWHHWRDQGILRIPGESMTPDGSNRIISHHLIAYEAPNTSDRIVSAEKRLPLGLPYTFSVWLWAPAPDTIDLIIRLPKNHIEVARATVTMTAQPTRFSVTGTPLKSSSWSASKRFISNYGDVEVVIGSTLDHPVSFANRPMAEFYAWGAQLEQSPVMTDYQGPTAGVTRTDFRTWSTYLLIANIFAMLSVLLWFFIYRRNITPLQITPAIFMALIVGEILVTQPEQRFVIAVEVYIWVYCLLFLCRQLFFRRQQALA